jgi:hypothetical protein
MSKEVPKRNRICRIARNPRLGVQAMLPEEAKGEEKQVVSLQVQIKGQWFGSTHFVIVFH